jgi:hypothetical protein
VAPILNLLEGTTRKRYLATSAAYLIVTSLLSTPAAVRAQSDEQTAAPEMASPAPSATPTPVGTLLPGGTTVVVALQEPISSSTAHDGDQIAIIAKKAVLVHGAVLIPEGANGHATVTSVEQAGGNGSGGKLAISIDWIYGVDGGKIKLTQTNHASESGDTKGASSTATIATYLLLGPIGLFAHNFVRGKDVTIDTKRTFTVFVDHDVYIKEPEAAQTADPYAPR